MNVMHRKDENELDLAGCHQHGYPEHTVVCRFRLYIYIYIYIYIYAVELA